MSEKKKSNKNEILDALMNSKMTDVLVDFYIAFGAIAVLYPFLNLGEIASQIVALYGKYLSMSGMKLPDNIEESIAIQYKRYENVILESIKNALESWIKSINETLDKKKINK